MSEIIESKIKEICPDKRLNQMYMIDVEEETHKILKELGYKESKTIQKAIDRTWANSDRTDFLWEFVLKVWRYDS